MCVRTMLKRWAISGALVVLVMVGAACESAPTATPSPQPVDEAQELDKLRSLAFAYWEAFNAYDADRVLGYLEESYRQQRDETIREEIGQDQALPRTAGTKRGDASAAVERPRGGDVLDDEGAAGHTTYPHGLP